MIVFVHGVPETAELWDPLRGHLDQPSVALSLPGFGCPRPSGFGATKDDYAEWLAAELKQIEGPIDLVGHDWGAGFTLRVATAHGDLVRSWVADVGNIVHPDYEWHDFAKIWQTPGDGEAFWKDQLALPLDQRAAVFEAFAVPHEGAVAMASRIDETMAACILALYRSAVPNPYADWGSEFGPTTAAGLLLHATEDPFSDEERFAGAAELLGARTDRLEGLGHWWALQDPAAGAAALKRFWGSL